MIIDTHAHILSEYYNEEEIKKIIENNIVILSGAHHSANVEIVSLCNKYSNVYGTLGIHPSEINETTDEHIKYIKDHINDKNIVAVGEIGLDGYCGSVDKQSELFIKLLDIAVEANKPVVIHSRDLFNDTYNILKNYPNLKKDIHCFSYGVEEALKLININSYLGIGGIVTFKNSQTLKNVVREIPIDRILIETDSPYLTPHPFRGRKNSSDYTKLICLKIAEIKGLGYDETKNVCNSNASRLFDLED